MKLLAQFNAWRSAEKVKRENHRDVRAVALLTSTNPRALNSLPRAQRRAIGHAVLRLNRTQPMTVRNWYESGNPWSDGSRSQIYDWPKDARYDQNIITRRTMEYRCRYWEQNSELLKRALDVSSLYVVGTHQPVVTCTASDSAWSGRAETVFAELCESAGLNGESMFALMDVAYRRKKVDGNILAVETSKPGTVIYRRDNPKYRSVVEVARPCYQLIESQRIGQAFAGSQEAQDNVVDGVQYREIETRLPDGRVRRQLVKAGYWVNDAQSLLDKAEYTFVPLENCFYWSTAHRVNEPRGLSDFYATEPTLCLIQDLLKMEMRAQEVQSDLTLFITNGAGQLVNDKMQATVGALGIKLSKSDDGQPVVTAKDVEAVKQVYDKIWGGRSAVGRTGDTLQFLAPNRPAEATLNLWNYLIDLFCSGATVPRILILSKVNKGQGTEVRAEIEAANSAWKKEFNLLPKPFLLRAWKYFIGWAIKYDERLKNPPPDWENIEVSPPRSVCVDLGYDSANKLAEMAAGVYSLHEFAQDHGTTKSKLIQNSVNDLFDIKLACAKKAEQPDYQKYGITVDASEVRNNLSEVTKNLAAARQAEAARASVGLQLENPELEPAAA